MPEINPIDIASLSERFRSRREAIGMSQSELARKLHVFPSYIWSIENGNKRPKIDFFGRAALALGCDVSALYPGFTATPDLDPPLVLVRSPRAGIWVARTSSDRALLSRLGYRVGVRADDMVGLSRRAERSGVAISIRNDLPEADPVPDDDGADGLGLQYRKDIYEWAASTVGDKLTDTAKEVFRRSAVLGEDLHNISVRLRIKFGSAKTMRSAASQAYGRLIRSPIGRKMAGMILDRVAGPREKSAPKIPSKAS